MSCSGAFDIKEDGQYDPCDKTICPFDYTYEYDNSTLCKVTKKGTYLKLECTTSSSKATIGQTQNMGVEEVRLYCPSVNKWDGEKADAELIIRHSGQGKNVYVCIPIVKTAGSQKGNGVDFFEALDSAVKVLDEGTQMQTVNIGAQWSLNKLIPKSPYYWAEKDGLIFDNACNYDSNNVLIFPLGGAINIKQLQLTNIEGAVTGSYSGGRRTINSSADELVSGSNAGQFFYNKEGTEQNTDGIEDGLPVGMTCEPVLDKKTGLNVVEDPAEKIGWIQNTMQNMNTDKLLYYVGIVLGVGAFILALYFIGYKRMWKHTVKDPTKPGEMTSIMGRWFALRNMKLAGHNVPDG
jgi:hypothetical protein